MLLATKMMKAIKYHLVALVVLQIALCFLYGYHKVYNHRPFSIHQWRQTDCASFTKNYYEEGMHFLQPEIHWQGDIKGKAVSEFPLVNYTVACLWKVFGEHESLYRLTVLCLYIISLLFLFMMVHATSDSLVYSYFATSLITTSPVLAYYSFSFLADVPALSFAIISISLFVLFMQNRQKKLFILALVFGTLATLLKASSATVLAIIGIISFMHVVGFPAKLLAKEKLFSSKLLPVIGFVLSALIIYAWYHFAFVYNNGNSNGVFLMETLPVWKMTDKVIETGRLLYSVQFAMYFNKGILLGLSLLTVWMLLNLRALPGYLKVSFLIALFSFGAFIILFFQVFNVHDYYLITTMIFPIILLVCFGAYLKDRSFNFMNKKLLVMVSLVFFVNAMYCASVVRLRNVPNDKLCKYSPFITSEEKNFSDWFHYNYEMTLKPLETITPYLRSLGIKREDKVISAPDPSFNISLYLMDQKGFTATEQSLQADTLKVNEYIALGAKYLVLTDTTLLHKTTLSKQARALMGHYKNVFIYKLN
jgi:hypothetical protein